MFQMGDAYLGSLPSWSKNESDLVTIQSFARTRNRRSEQPCLSHHASHRRPSPVSAEAPKPLKSVERWGGGSCSGPWLLDNESPMNPTWRPWPWWGTPRRRIRPARTGRGRGGWGRGRAQGRRRGGGRRSFVEGNLRDGGWSVNEGRSENRVNEMYLNGCPFPCTSPKMRNVSLDRWR
jgi:hypothetical protein